MTRILTLLNMTFTVHRLPVDSKIPEPVLESLFYHVTRTKDELSILLPDTVKVHSAAKEPGWACFQVKGPLDFGLVGLLADISSALAEANVPLFALSTFETDYILVKREQAQTASEALKVAGFIIERESS